MVLTKREIVQKYKKLVGWSFVVIMIAAIDRTYNQIWDIAERVYPDTVTRYENVLPVLLLLLVFVTFTGWVISRIVPSALST
jgi:hypothetical protein